MKRYSLSSEMKAGSKRLQPSCKGSCGKRYFKMKKKLQKKRKEGGKCVFYETYPFGRHVLARELSLATGHLSVSTLSRSNTELSY